MATIDAVGPGQSASARRDLPGDIADAGRFVPDFRVSGMGCTPLGPNLNGCRAAKRDGQHSRGLLPPAFSVRAAGFLFGVAPPVVLAGARRIASRRDIQRGTCGNELAFATLESGGRASLVAGTGSCFGGLIGDMTDTFPLRPQERLSQSYDGFWILAPSAIYHRCLLANAWPDPAFI